MHGCARSEGRKERMSKEYGQGANEHEFAQKNGVRGVRGT